MALFGDVAEFEVDGEDIGTETLDLELEGMLFSMSSLITVIEFEHSCNLVLLIFNESIRNAGFALSFSPRIASISS